MVTRTRAGNGKTATAIAAAQVELRRDPTLKVTVVAPKSLIGNFQNALVKFGVCSEDVSRYSFYTFEAFAIKQLERPDLLAGSLLIVDEAHHARTDVYPNVRAKVKAHAKRIDKIPAADRSPQQTAYVERLKLIQDALTASGKRDYSWPVDDVLRFTGVDISQQTPRSLRLLMAGRYAVKVLLLTATPCYNATYDVANLTSLLTGRGVMSHRHFKHLLKDKFAFERTFRGLFAFKDVEPDDPAFPKLEIETVRIPMTQEYYQEYHRIENDNREDWTRPWIFMAGVRQAALGLEDNPKCAYVQSVLEQDCKTPTLVHSAFISKGLRKMQSLIEAKVPFLEITGDTPVHERDEAIQAINDGDVGTLFVSNAGGEGLDLKGLRRGFLLETEWNAAQTLQVVGRGPRRGSHNHLPEHERKVKFVQLILTKPPPEQRFADDKFKWSADELLEQLTQEKQAEIDPFLAHLKGVSQ